MRTIRELSREELRDRLDAGRLMLRTGDYVSRVRSRIGSVAAGVELMYADYEVLESGFADFHVEVAGPRSARRWIAPQVLFYFDGKPPFKPLPLAQAYPMLEWGLNWCVSSQSQDQLVIHAAGMERFGRAMILPGQPGSGKSTLVAAMVLTESWRLLSDELVRIDPQTRLARPLPRPISLKNQSIDVIRKYAPDAIVTPVVNDTLKGSVAHVRAPRTSVELHQRAAEPAWVLFPRYRRGASLSMRDLPKGEAFMRLAENCMNYSVLGERGYELLGALVDACDCYECEYGDLAQVAPALNRLAAAERTTA